jgi:hypothetical protein
MPRYRKVVGDPGRSQNDVPALPPAATAIDGNRHPARHRRAGFSRSHLQDVDGGMMANARVLPGLGLELEATRAPARPRRPPSEALRSAHFRALPLMLILAAQAALSVRIINHIPSDDEARYIYAGHQLIYELLHGGGSPFYETYFSGAPDIYPPVAAIADHLGGIIAVRLLSLIFMLVTTTILFATTQRIYGYWAGCAAAALFAATGLTHSLGVYANYDAMAFMFVALAAYCGVRAGNGAARWLLVVPVALLLANATKYMTLLYDPFVICLAALQIRGRGWRRVLERVATLSVATVASLALAAYLAGGSYIQGVLYTTLARPTGTNVVLGANYTPPGMVLIETWGWIGVVFATGAFSVLMAIIDRKSRGEVLTLIVLVTAGLMVTVEALRLHSDESMRQHEDFGAWFTCIAAGYGLSLIPARVKFRVVKAIAAAATIPLFVGTAGYYATHETIIDTFPGQSVSQALALDAVVRPYLQLRGGHFLMSGGFAKIVYADHVNIPWFNLVDDNYLKYPIPGRGGDSHGEAHGLDCTKLAPGCMYLTGPAAYKAAIRAHWFTFISLAGRFVSRFPQDAAIFYEAEHVRGYVPITDIGDAPTWIYVPAYKHRM